MRGLAIILLTFCLPCLALAEPPHPDWAELAGTMSGEYTVIGRRPDSRKTYSGHLSFRAEGEGLAFVRTINGQIESGTGRFELVSSENRPALRLYFLEDGRWHDGLYEWRRDHHNALRFTGFIMSLPQKTTLYGAEAFFPAPSRQDMPANPIPGAAPNENFAHDADVISGKYTLMGNEPGSGMTYTGHISLRPNGEKVAFVRTVNGRTVRGMGFFAYVPGGPRPVFRLRFPRWRVA